MNTHFKSQVVSFFLLILCFSFESHAQKVDARGQYFVIREYNSPYEFNYILQANYVEKWLQTGAIYPQLKLSKRFNVSGNDMKSLAQKFQKGYPSKLFEIGSTVVIEVKSKQSHHNTPSIRDIYCQFNDHEEIIVFIQYATFFEPSDDVQKDPFVLGVKVDLEGILLPVSKDEIIRQYHEKSETLKSLPPFPPTKKN